MEFYLEHVVIPLLTGLAVALITRKEVVSGKKRVALILLTLGVAFLVVVGVTRWQRANTSTAAAAVESSLPPAGADTSGGSQRAKGVVAQAGDGSSSPLSLEETTGSPPRRPEGLGRSVDPKGWAVLIASADGTKFPELDRVAEEDLHRQGLHVVALDRTLFPATPAPQELDSGVLVERLHNHYAGIIVGKANIGYEQNESLAGVVTARLTTDFQCIDVRSGAVKGRFALADVGTGFSETQALAMAEKKVAVKLKSRLIETTR
jgi:hypothetical protein